MIINITSYNFVAIKRKCQIFQDLLKLKSNNSFFYYRDGHERHFILLDINLKSYETQRISKIYKATMI